jgi:hypothetical protein
MSNNHVIREIVWGLCVLAGKNLSGYPSDPEHPVISTAAFTCFCTTHESTPPRNIVQARATALA